MTEEPRLDLETTYQAIRKAALEHRFISYGDLAEANRVPWIKARRAIPQQLGQLVTLAHERGWPMPSAIVVNKENVESGTLEGSARDGFIAAARDIGLTIADPAQFVKEQQQKVFAWAKTAPETLGLVPGEQDATAKTGPRFIQYFGSVLNALRDVGGEAKPKDVIDWIISHEKVPETILKATTKGGHSRFENQVGWARFYLVKAGLIDDRKRGIWALTPEGRDTRLTHESALEIFKDVRAQGWGDDDDNTPAPPTSDNAAELFADTARQFWFVGAAWDEGDQADRFLTEGVWQNGYDEKFTDLVRTMRPGDRIAIKSSFVRKHKLPFNAGGKSVSCMRIKAIGTIIENPGDGKTVRVDWTTVDPPRDWFFYTYRTTIIQADSNDDLARRLILFTFADAPQDYQFWLQVPYFARKYGASSQTATLEKVFVDNDDDEAEAAAAAAEAPTYSADNIAADGCFLSRAAIDGALDRLKDKLNIILQGPPGTGKTWLARRLAYALIGSKDRKVTQARMRVVQFHPSLSYEDFVRGWRPTAGGKLELVDGIFLKAVQAASAEPDLPFVLIIEEINRGNPAQVFGEMLTLLEDTKRQQDEALELAYSREGEKPIHIPRNLHVIGTMNIADRSLALVDLALRRRFAFITLEPQLGPLWRAWCAGKAGLDAQVIDLIEQRITALNTEIAGDRSLGPQFRIGHSFVTPREGAIIANGKAWFSQVVETEIAPLLEEYWYDAVVKATEAKRHLLAGLT
jgi:5-methylcytosine-specific restriction protein B